MATVRPPPLQNASRQLASCRAPRHCRLSTPPSSHATAAPSDFFCVPFGGRANGRVSTPPTPSATTAARRRERRLHLRHRLRRLRPALPASSAHLRRDVQLGFRRRLRRLRPRLGVPPGPGPTACAPDHPSHVVRKHSPVFIRILLVLYMTESTSHVVRKHSPVFIRILLVLYMTESRELKCLM